MKSNDKSCGIKTSIGGQALLEGIMMRGPKKTAMAVRNPAGEIVIEECENEKSTRPKFFKLPFVRGIFNFIDSMKCGYKYLMRSAEISGLEEAEAEIQREKEEKKRKKAAERAGIPYEPTAEVTPETAEPEKTESDAEAPATAEKKSGGIATAAMLIGTVLGIALAVVLFVFLPTWLSTLVLGKNATTEHPVLVSVLSGIVKVIILVGYMAAVSLLKDIRRTFMYHGAEHKTIFCYEHGHELTVENIRKERRFHPRCGTSFLVLMVIVSVIIMIPISLGLRAWLPESILTNRALYTIIRTLIAILLIPLMTGIGYELIKLAGRHDNLFTKIISAPGMWLQHITTKEPDDSMIECAIAAVKRVIPDDESDRW